MSHIIPNYSPALWDQLSAVLVVPDSQPAPLANTRLFQQSTQHSQTTESFPPIKISKAKCATAARITNVQKSFCGRNGVASVLPLDMIQWDTFVSHDERQRLQKVESSEESGRVSIERAESAIILGAFNEISSGLKKMHEERVLSHLQHLLDEEAARAAVEAIEETRRVPLSHQHTSGLFGTRYLEQILKRGAIVEDDMKRERKFTGRNERNERVQLINSFLSAMAATAARESANIEHLSMRAESFVKAARTFHTLYHGTGDAAGSPMRVVMDRRYNASGKAGHKSTTTTSNSLDTTVVRKIQKALSKDPTQYSHARLLKSLLHHKEYTLAAIPIKSLDYATNSQGEVVATPQAETTNLVLTLRFHSLSTLRIRVSESEVPVTIFQEETGKGAEKEGDTNTAVWSSSMFSPQGSKQLFESMHTICDNAINDLAQSITDTCEEKGDDSVFDDLTVTVAGVVAEDLRLVCSLVVPAAMVRSDAVTISTLGTLIDGLRADLACVETFDFEMQAFVKVLRPILQVLRAGGGEYAFARVALLLLNAIINRCVDALSTLNKSSSVSEDEDGDTCDCTDNHTPERGVAVFSESCLWLSGAFLVASNIYPWIKNTVVGGGHRFASTYLEECATLAALHSHAWLHEWYAGLGGRLGVLRTVGVVEHPTYPANVRLLASHWVRTRVAKQHQAYTTSKKMKALEERLAKRRSKLAEQSRSKRGGEASLYQPSSHSVDASGRLSPSSPSLRNTNDQLSEFRSMVDNRLSTLQFEADGDDLTEKTFRAAVGWLCGDDAKVDSRDFFGLRSFCCPTISVCSETATYACVPTNTL